MIKVINHNQTKLFEQAGAELVQAKPALTKVGVKV